MVPGNLFQPSTIIRSALGLLFYDTRLKYRLGSFCLSPSGRESNKIKESSIYLCFTIFYYGLY